MKIYLVDTENVGLSWLKEAKQSSSDSMFYIFASINAQPLHYKHLNDILEIGHKLKFFECYTGQNALDFQLSSYLGYLISINHNEAEYIILSKDKGYDPVCNFWKQEGISVTREEIKKTKEVTSACKADEVVTISELATNKIHKINNKPYSRVEFKTIIKNVLPAECDIIMRIVNTYEFDLNRIHNELINSFGERKGKRIYLQIRPILKKYINAS